MTDRRRSLVRLKILRYLPALTLYSINRKSPKEIARETGRSLKWVHRVLARFA